MNTIQLDCALSYLNEGKVTNPIELLSEQIDSEINQFNSLMESCDILNEKVDLKAAFEKVKNLIHKLLEKIRLAVRSLKGRRFMKAKKEKEEKSNSSSEEKKYSYPEVIIEYNDKKYSQLEFDKLIAVIVEQLGGNHIFNIIHGLFSEDIDKLKEGFENFKSYYTKFNSDLTRTIEHHKDLSSSEVDKYRSSYNKIQETILKEYKWADNALKDWESSFAKLQYRNSPKTAGHAEGEEYRANDYRMEVSIYMIDRMNKYINILDKIDSMYTTV